MAATQSALGAILVIGLLGTASCATPASPEPVQASSTAAANLLTDDTSWVAQPSTFPIGWMGRNNCTFAIPIAAGSDPVWDAHPEGGCWERPGPDNQTRQALNAVHYNSLAACGGGPGDISGLRLCVADAIGQAPVETICGPTGPGGCAVCEPATTVCH